MCSRYPNGQLKLANTDDMILATTELKDGGILQFIPHDAPRFSAIGEHSVDTVSLKGFALSAAWHNEIVVNITGYCPARSYGLGGLLYRP